MAVFNPIVITTAGISLLSQAMAGKGTLTFTSVATSTTVIPYNISNIQAMTALSGIVQTVVPVSAVLKTGNVQVSSIFSNSSITNAYTANTIGLYAALGNGAQTLFAVAIATTPDNIPVQNDLSPSNFYYQFNIAISDTSQLTVTVPEDGSLPASVFNQMFPGITAPDQNNDGDALVYNASSGAWGYVNTETVFTTVSESGEFVSLQKTLADDFKQIQLFGKSVQAETTGAQLFNVNVCKNETSVQYKITIDDYATGKITVSIDNPEGAVAMPVNRLSDYCPTMTAGKTYYLSGKHDDSYSGSITLLDVSSNWDLGTSREITEQDLQSAVQFGFGTYSNIMIVEGSTGKPYEVYTGGEAATEPTPDYPLPITSAGNYDDESEKYEIGIGVDGANLLDYDDWKGTGVTRGTGEYKDYGVVLVATKNDCYTNYSSEAYKILVSPDTVYCLSWEHSGSSGDVHIFENGITASGYGHFVSAIDKKLVFKTRNDTTFVRFRVGVQNSGDTATYKNIQLNVGDTPLEFRPFQGTQQKVLQLPNPFRGIPVDSGGNYTDAEGQQWLCDYIDRERGKYVQCVQKIVLDGSENRWEYISISDSVNQPYLSIKDLKTDTNNKNLLCDRFKPILISDRENNYNTVYTGFNSEKNDVICFNVENIENLDEWKTFISQNNVRVLYQLKNPIETDLTPDQIAALNLSTYQGITNIGTDTMPQVGMTIESQGFNLAGDLAQNVIDLQTTVQTQAGEIETLQNTVQSQSSAIAENTEKRNTLGLVGYGRKTASQSGESISLASLIPEWSDTFTSGALYSVYFSVSFSEYDSGDTTFQPYILKSIRNGLQTTITQVELPTVYYQANSGNIIPYSCTFMIATDSDEDVSGLEFHVDGNSHNFKDMTVAVYRIR